MRCSLAQKREACTEDTTGGVVRKAVSIIAKNTGVAIQCSKHQLTRKGQKENCKGRRKPHRKDEEIQSNITFQSSITTTQRLPPLH